MTIESITTILLSGVLAAVISVFGALYLERKRRKQETQGQSLSLITAMEGFVVACAEYISQVADGMQVLGDTQDHTQLSKTRGPNIIIPAHVDFGKIDPKISSEIIILPILAKRARVKAEEEAAYNCSIDAYNLLCDEYSRIGLKAWQLSDMLREKSGLPKASHLESWEFLEILKSD